MPITLSTSIPGLAKPKIGKVREVYDLGDQLLIVATDRISAFDVVMANGIPDKGRILNQMSAFWFEKFQDICPNHVVSIDDEVILEALALLNGEPRTENGNPTTDDRRPINGNLSGRSTLAKRAKPLPIECVVRGYLAGSLLKEYKATGGSVHGFGLPEGLINGSQLQEPIFTPATKAEKGHDENLSWKQAVDIVGKETAETVKNWSLNIYKRASEYSAGRGILLADTKFEFGETEDGLIWIDEALTPDSSRFWPAESYKPGSSQPSYDKQFVRDYLESIQWNKQPPGPVLPDDVVSGTRAKYLEAFERLVGRSLVL
jgi:phosphoribosylaminoimidazole-succinocarboxamide synthase